MVTVDHTQRNGGSSLSKCQVVLLLVGVLALEHVVMPEPPCGPRLRGPPAATARGLATAAAEWPPGGVAWNTGAAAVEAAKNKTPRRGDEAVSNHPFPSIMEKNKGHKFKESALFHTLLDGLHGIEIGSAAHNGFGLDTLNVDFTNHHPGYQKGQISRSGVYRRVDIIANGDRLPFSASSLDFVVSSHVVDLLNDPIGFMCEAARVVKPGGYIASILPQHPVQNQERTLLSELIQRHYHPMDTSTDYDLTHGVWQQWMVEDMIEMCHYMNLKVVTWQGTDDKAGNGFSVVVMVPENKLDLKC